MLHRFARARLVLLFLLCLASLPRAAQAQSTPVKPLPPVKNEDIRFGAVQAFAAPDLAVNAGVRWERIIFAWNMFQPNGPTQWMPAVAEELIRQEIERGIEVVGVVLYTPSWAASDPSRGTTAVPKNLYLPPIDSENYWGRFTGELARRYAGLVNTWIIWNEPDLYDARGQFTWAGTVEDYYQLVKVASINMKANNALARIVLAGMTYWWDRENGRDLYLSRLLDVAKRDPSALENDWYFDAVNLHVYVNPLNAFVAPLAYLDVMHYHGMEKPIWITEMNVVPSDDPIAPLSGRPFLATMDQQASFVIQALALGLAVGAERVSIYKLRDDVPEEGQYFGLVRNDGSLRPAYVAYQVAAKYLSGFKEMTYTWAESGDAAPDEEALYELLASNEHHHQWIWPGPINRVVAEKRGLRVTVIWNTSPQRRQGVIPAVSKKATLVDKYGNIREVTPRDGRYLVDLEPTTHNADPREPNIYLIGGSPLLLVEKVPTIPEEVDAHIQVDTAGQNLPPDRATVTRLSVILTTVGSLEPVPCDWQPAVRLWRAEGNEPARPIAVGTRRLERQGDLAYQVWDFPEVDISAARAGRLLAFFVTVDGATTHSTVWVHAIDGRSIAEAIPPPRGLAQAPAALDARVEVVFPTDGASVAEARRANVAVALYQHGTDLVVPSNFDATVRLFVGRNGQVEEEIGGAVRTLVTVNGLTYPRWTFNNVDVSAARTSGGRVTFRAMVDEYPSYPTVWNHSATARTRLPEPVRPSASCET